MASSTDTKVNSFVVNEVASDDVLKQMETNGQIETDQYFMTPDETDDTFMPIGMIFQSAIPIDDARVHALDGSTVAISGIYADFVNYLKQQKAKGYDLYYTYASDYDATLGLHEQCGKFLVDETNGILRFPTVRFFTEGVRNLSQICQVLDAGLPNIIGNIDWVVSWTGGYGGAFYNVANNNSSSGGGSDVARNYVFDASRSNPIYGNSTTVQPQAVRYPYYIVVASGYKSTQQVNFDNIATELNPLKKRYLVDSYVNGTTWYNIYSDGWKECGGFVNNGNAVKSITFPVTFSSKPLQINATSFYSIIDQTLYQPHIDDITTTSFNVASYGERGSGTNGSGNPIYWEAKGY